MSEVVKEIVGRQGRNLDVRTLPRKIMDSESREQLVHSLRIRGKGVHHLRRRRPTSRIFPCTRKCLASLDVLHTPPGCSGRVWSLSCARYRNRKAAERFQRLGGVAWLSRRAPFSAFGLRTSGALFHMTFIDVN